VRVRAGGPFGERRGGGAGRRCRQESTRVIDVAEQLLYFPAQLRCIGAHRIEELRPAFRGATKRGVEHLSDALPAIAIDCRRHAETEPPENPGAVGLFILARGSDFCESRSEPGMSLADPI
jgi:hypothetical protein